MKSFGIRIFGFFFFLQIILAILFFFLTAFPAILSTYGIDTIVQVSEDLLQQGLTSQESHISVLELKESYRFLYTIADYIFLFFIVSVFINSIIAAVNTKKEGILTFFGYMTLGNVILIFLLTYAVQIQNWIINNIVYSVLLININTPFTLWFFDFSIYIGTFWYTLLLVINIIDLKSIASKFGLINSKRKEGEFEPTEDFLAR